MIEATPMAIKMFCQIVVVVLFATLPAAADPIGRNEIFVKDGDTIVKAPPGVRHSPDKEYRLVGFDTPETSKGDARQRLRKAIAQRQG
jgi:endonuclease YncB( thermonuclease family)